jgi:dipeptidyl aminopeptidase/acylaminoacyl peptidase
MAGREFILRDRVGDPEADRAMLLAHSPVEQAARIQAPLQLIWGSDDLRVPIVHGERLRAALQKAGREPEWIVYPGEAHGLRMTANLVDRALRLEAFLARHLK